MDGWEERREDLLESAHAVIVESPKTDDATDDEMEMLWIPFLSYSSIRYILV